MTELEMYIGEGQVWAFIPFWLPWRPQLGRMCNIRIEIARMYQSICKTILTFACNSQVLASNRKCWQAVRKHSQCVLKKMSKKS